MASLAAPLSEDDVLTSSEEESDGDEDEPVQSDEALRRAEDLKVANVLDETNVDISSNLGRKEGYVLVGKTVKASKQRYLLLDKSVLMLKKKKTDKKPLKHQTFDLKNDIQFKKNDTEPSYVGRCFTVHTKDDKEELRIFTDTTEALTEWFEMLSTNKIELDQAASRKKDKKLGVELGNFNSLWGTGGDDADTDDQDAANSMGRGSTGSRTSSAGGGAGPVTRKSMVASSASLHPPEYRSFLTKRGGTFKTWRKRFFVLEAFTLSYYKKEGDKKPKAIVSIDPECKVLPSVTNKKIKKKRPDAFCLETHGRTYYLDCENNEIKSEWLYKLRKTIEMAKDAVKGYEKEKVTKQREARKKKRESMVEESKSSHGRTDSTVSRIGHDDDDTTDEENGLDDVAEVDEEDEDEDRPEQLGGGGSGGGGSGGSGGAAGGGGSGGDGRSDGRRSSMAQMTPEERVTQYLSRFQEWNRINETNMKEDTSQVEFYCIATKMRPPASTRRRSVLGGHGSGGGGGHKEKPLGASHLRVHQSQFMKESRFPPNVDLSSLKYQGIGKHLCRTNVVEKEAVAVYSRATVIDCPIYGDRAIELAVHVEDPRAKCDVEKPWAKARFTLSQLLGSENGRLRLPLMLETKGPPGADGIKVDKFGREDILERPRITVILSKCPYEVTHARSTICKTWGAQSQTFALRTMQQKMVLCREEVHETLTSFQIPLLYLKLRAAEWIKNLKSVKERCEKLLKIFIEQDEKRARDMQEAQEVVERDAASKVKGSKATDDSAAPPPTASEVASAKKKLTSLRKEMARKQSTEERSKWVIEHMQSHNRIVSQYSAAIDLLTPLFQQIPPNAYMNKCISLTFKKSADKKKSALRMMPTNLHLCWWRVWVPEELPIHDDDFEMLSNMLTSNGSSPGTPGRASGRHSSSTPLLSKSDFKRQSMMVPSMLPPPRSPPPADEGESKVGGGGEGGEGEGEGGEGGGGGEESDEEEEEEQQKGDTGASMDFQKSFYADGKGEKDTIYDCVTFGAPAAHVLGFKKGGLRALLNKRTKLLAGDDEENEDLLTAEKRVQWFYLDEEKTEQGPMETKDMRHWYAKALLDGDLLTRLSTDGPNEWIPLSTRFPNFDEAFPDNYGMEALESMRAAEFIAAGQDKSNRGKDELRQDAESLTLKIEQRRDLIVCQSLSALVLSFGARLEVLGNRSSTFLHQLAHVGYLFQVESLVSTHGDEQGMLDDFIEAMKELNNVAFRLQQLGGVKDAVKQDLWKKRENLTQIRGRMAATTESSDKYKKLAEASDILEGQIRESMQVAEESWYYCDDNMEVRGPFPASHMQSWYPDYLDDNIKILKEGEGTELWMTIGERFAHCQPFPEPSIAAVRVGQGLTEISMERGEDEKCIVTIKVPDHLWAKLPETLKAGQLINVFPVLIQQGINEFQTIANLTGSRSKLQNVVNSNAVKVYKDYMEKVEAKAHEIGLDSEEIKIAQRLFRDLETVVSKENPRRKNVEIIQCAQRATRALRGGRGICCKSAKDRTSMSHTLEEAQLLYHNEAETRIEEVDRTAAKLSVEDRTILANANILREYGVRVMNSKKNVGKKKFAFNSIQRKRLPKLYRPPRSVMIAAGKDKVES